MMRTIVFDLDGTLVDTAPDLISALNLVLSREGLPPVGYDHARRMIGGGSRRHDRARLDCRRPQRAGCRTRSHIPWFHRSLRCTHRRSLAAVSTPRKHAQAAYC